MEGRSYVWKRSCELREANKILTLDQILIRHQINEHARTPAIIITNHQNPSSHLHSKRRRFKILQKHICSTLSHHVQLGLLSDKCAQDCSLLYHQIYYNLCKPLCELTDTLVEKWYINMMTTYNSSKWDCNKYSLDITLLSEYIDNPFPVAFYALRFLGGTPKGWGNKSFEACKQVNLN